MKKSTVLGLFFVVFNMINANDNFSSYSHNTSFTRTSTSNNSDQKSFLFKQEGNSFTFEISSSKYNPVTCKSVKQDVTYSGTVTPNKEKGTVIVTINGWPPVTIFSDNKSFDDIVQEAVLSSACNYPILQEIAEQFQQMRDSEEKMKGSFAKFTAEMEQMTKRMEQIFPSATSK